MRVSCCRSPKALCVGAGFEHHQNLGDVGGVSGMQFAAERTAVRLNGLFADTEFKGDLLIEHTFGNHLGDVFFACRQLVVDRTDAFEFFSVAAAFDILFNRFFNRVKQPLGLHGLRQEVDSTVLQSLNGHIDIAVSGDKNNL